MYNKIIIEFRFHIVTWGIKPCVYIICLRLQLQLIIQTLALLIHNIMPNLTQYLLFHCAHLFSYFCHIFLAAGKGPSNGCNDSFVKLLASLSMQVCELNPPFCQDLHEVPQSMQTSPNFSVIKKREETLQVLVSKEMTLHNEKLKLEHKPIGYFYHSLLQNL